MRGNPHAAFDAAGAGNVAWSRWCDTRRRKSEPYADGREAARGIAEWIAFYNERRPHQALTDRAPIAVWREAIAGAEAVDMMDNAPALPTCPQPQKQTQPLAA